MNKPSTRPPSGTRDFLPADVARRRHVVGVVEEVYVRYGFAPLETPAYENLDTLLGKYGEEGDQLLFRLLHRRDALARALEKEGTAEADLADLGLRYDLTVPLARVMAEHPELPRFFKRYQIQPVWRADRPGRGRYREFFQCDVDVLGTTSLVAEAEVMGAAAEVLRELKFEAFEVRYNHRELLRGLVRAVGIEEAREAEVLVVVDKLDKITRDAVVKELLERGLVRQQAEDLMRFMCIGVTYDVRPRVAVDDKVLLEQIRNVVPEGPAREAADKLKRLADLLDATPAGPHARFRPDLVRGLSYYTGPIFEIAAEGLAGSLGGGGRYDGLVGMFGKRPIPAVGFSLGLERILLVMEERGMYPELRTGPDVLLCWREVPEADVLRAARSLREQGLSVEVYPEPARLAKQIQYADRNGVKARVAAILGESELRERTITLKNLESGEQRTEPLDRAAAAISAWQEGTTP